MSIIDQGAMKISVDSGIGQYDYIMSHKQSSIWIRRYPTDSLTDKQKDYVTFLHMSKASVRDLGKARHEEDYIPFKRVPENFEHGVEGLNPGGKPADTYSLQVAFISRRTRPFEYETLLPLEMISLGTEIEKTTGY